MPLRILHYLKSIRLEEGGVVRAVLDLCGALAAAGHEVTLLTYDDKDVPPEWKRAEPGHPRSIALERPSGRAGRLGAGALERARAALREADVAHIHAVWIPSNAQIANEAAALGVPSIVTIHGMLDDWSMAQRHWKKRLYLALAGRKMLERAAFVHSTAEFERVQSVKWYPRGRAIVVPLVFDLSPFANLPGPDQARDAFPLAASDLPKALFLSRLHEKKGLPVLIEAARILKDRGTPVALLIAGSGETDYVDSLRAMVKDKGLDETTVFTGLVVGTTKVSLFEAADLFVLPTSQENFGFVLPEALACGTPAVTTRGVDIWPELEESGGALIAEPTAEAFADAIAGLIADRARLEEMGRRGRAWVFDRLDGARVVGEYVRMYGQARTGAGSGSQA